MTTKLKWMRIILAGIVFLCLSYAFLARIPIIEQMGAHLSKPLLEEASWLAHIQFIPSLLGSIHGVWLSIALFSGIFLLTLLFGRVYCSVICPLGITQDILYWIRSWITPKSWLRYRKAIPFVRYAVLILLALGCIIGFSAYSLNWIDPYSIYGRMMNILVQPGVSAINNSIAGSMDSADIVRVPAYHAGWLALGIVSATMLIVAIMSIWKGRLYCNTICPVGTVLGIISRFSLFRIGFDKDACKRCGKCLKACKAQCLDLKQGTVDSSRCVACYNCMDACSEHGIKYRWFTKVNKGASFGKACKKTCESPKNQEMAIEESKKLLPDPWGLSSRRAFLGTAALGVASMALSSCKAQGAAVLDPTKTVLPPGAGNLDRFLDTCTACQLCIATCPTRVLQPSGLELGVKGFMKPRMDFRTKYCLYDCHRCAEVCPTGAIQKMKITAEPKETIQTKDTTRIAVASFYPCRCLVRREDMDCGACTEHCPTKALYTVPYIGSDGQEHRIPRLDPDLCIGCGACEYACPVTTEKEEAGDFRKMCGSCAESVGICDFKKQKGRKKPDRAIIIRAVNPQQHAKKKFEEKAIDPVGDVDFPF